MPYNLLSMQTLTVEIIDQNGLKMLQSMEQKHFIRIVNEDSLNSPSLPGGPMTMKAFKAWISDAENGPSLQLKEVKAKWASKRKELQKLAR